MNAKKDKCSKESIKLVSTPKFRKIDNKENNSKNNSLVDEIYSFNESKNENKNNDTKNELEPFNSKEEIKEKEDKIYKDNFSLSSLFNIFTNDTNKIDNTNENDDKNENALISFCDKSENNSYNNEIIYKEKDINSSIITNKDNKDKNLIIMTQNHDLQENTIINDNTSNSNLNNIHNEDIYSPPEVKKENKTQNNETNSFKYNLPLESDKTPKMKGIYEYDSIEHTNKNINLNKSLDLENNDLDFEIIKKSNKLNMNKKSILFNKCNFTYSKKKVKRNNTEKLSRTFKIFSLEKKDEDEIKKIESLIDKNKGFNKITIKKSILNRYKKYNKVKKEIKNSPLNTSLEKENENAKLSLFHSSNYNTISPKVKLKLIINEIKIEPTTNNGIDKYNYDYHKTNIDNLNEVKSFSLREKYDFISIPFDLGSINYNNKNMEYYKNNSKSKINFFSTHKLIKNRRKLNKSSFDFNNTLYNFKVKRLNDNDENNIKNIKKEENNNSKEITNKSRKLIYKKSSKNIINNKKNNNVRTRNTNSLFNSIKGSNNNILFHTINYENNEFKKYNSKGQKFASFIHSKYKNKIHINSSLLPKNKITNKRNKLTNNKFRKEKSHYNLKNIHNNLNKNIYNTNIVNKKTSQNNKDETKYKFQYKLNKNENNSSYNKPYNLVFNNYNNKCINYNSNHSNTERRINRDHNSSLRNNNSNKIKTNFSSINNSSNSLLNSQRQSSINKIKVNINRHNKMTTSPNLSSNSNQKKNYWKIYKKPKNCCLLNKFSNDINKYDYNSTQYGYDINHTNRVNSLFIKFKENKINNNYIKENDSSFTYEYLNTQNNVYYSINDNFNIEQNRQELNNTQRLNSNKIYKKSIKINRKNNLFRNKSNENRELHKTNIPNINNDEINEDIIKLSIIRNNLNNRIIKEFSIFIGEERNKKE